MLPHALKWMNRRLFQVGVLNTTMCNARCPYCCSAGILNQPKGELTLEEFGRIAGRLPDFPWLTISGGEPFMRKDVTETASIFIEQNNVELVSLITNGFFTDRIVSSATVLAEQYPKTRIGVSISVDDIGGRHDRVRRSKGAYRNLLKTFRELKARQQELKNLNIKFNSVITVHNYRHLDDIMREIRALGPDMHTLNFIRTTWDSGEVKFPKKDELPGIFDRVVRYYESYGKKGLPGFNRARVAVQRQYLRLIPETLEKKTQVIPCYAYKHTLILYPKGEVAFCDVLKPFANIRDFDYDYEKLMRSRTAKDTARFIRNKGCWCYSPCVQYMNLVHNPKTMLNAVRFVLKG